MTADDARGLPAPVDADDPANPARGDLAVANHPGLADDEVALIETSEEFPLEGPDDAGRPDSGGGAISVLRRALRANPGLLRGVRTTLLLAVIGAGGRVVVPILIQQVLDRGVLGPEGLRLPLVAALCAVAGVATLSVMLLSRLTYARVVRIAEENLADLRVRTFAHIHRLSVAELDETRRGVLTSRVTSDIETVARFAQWGAIAWIVNPVVILVLLGVLAFYAWQLAVLVIVVLLPLLPVLRFLQQRQLKAYDAVRTRVGHTLTALSEAVMGSAVVRAYGLEDRTRRRLGVAIDDQLAAERHALRFTTASFSTSDFTGSVVTAAVLFAGAVWGSGWGLDTGSLLASVFLVTLVVGPITELNEILDQTQTAVAGFRKVLDVLDTPIELVEPEPGVVLPDGPLSLRTEALWFSYRTGPPVLRDVVLDLPAGANVAVVGETGSGKSTLVRLFCRLADPSAGRVLVDGVDLRHVAAASRRAHIRLVPQDGFLFDATIGENVALGREGSGPDDVARAFAALDLEWWLAQLPRGLDTPVGERGDQLSVGERQLVSLARAQLADPGLLILDEATSAVDSTTERALTAALARLAAGRTTVSVAHRLSTAEAADRVLVFDHGVLVEQGPHAELVASGGRYAELYRSWLGSTREVTTG